MKRSLMFALTALIMLPAMIFVTGCTEPDIDPQNDDTVKGAVIGYAAGWKDAPTAAQLDMLTHVMVFQILPNANGSLNTNSVLKNLDQFVDRAHAKNVKVSIAVGGWIKNVSPNHTDFASAASATHRTTFVNNLVNYVNQYNLDGIDIDWEYPQGENEWNDFISLCSELKTNLSGKRISAALSGSAPNNSNFPGNVRSGIWNALDAIHLMSYDMNNWPTHSDAGKSKNLIDAWATWGNGQPGFDKEKLVIGCAFYANDGSPGDNTQSLKEKVDHCYDKGYGGVMIWELSDDLPNNTLLTAIYNANKAKGGYTGENR
jgi:GH18 family chitinase